MERIQFIFEGEPCYGISIKWAFITLLRTDGGANLNVKAQKNNGKSRRMTILYGLEKLEGYKCRVHIARSRRYFLNLKADFEFINEQLITQEGKI